MGGLVTSHEAGLAVPDWPTSYGYNMFLFPLRFWQGGIFYEHSHRLAASLIGLLTMGLALWLWIKEPRRWLRWLGLAALLTVVLQGVLGGIRVTLLKDQIGIIHATLAQLFLTLLAIIAMATSTWWPRLAADLRRRPATQAASRWMLISTILIFLQLVLGATMRHQHAGLAIPDFPLAYHQLWPQVDASRLAAINQNRLEVVGVKPITLAQIHLQMVHRLMAMLVVALVAVSAWKVRRAVGKSHLLAKYAAGWMLLSWGQVLLGAMTIWSNKAADIATAHVILGALLLVAGTLLTLTLFEFPKRQTSRASRRARGELSEPVLVMVASAKQ